MLLGSEGEAFFIRKAQVNEDIASIGATKHTPQKTELISDDARLQRKLSQEMKEDPEEEVKGNFDT